LVDHYVINYVSFLIKFELEAFIQYFMYVELIEYVNFVEFILMAQIIKPLFKYLYYLSYFVKG
jgi:bacterioferritin (cytochrome b1)